MLRNLFEGVSLLSLPVAAMLLFLAIFLLVLVRVSRRGAKRGYDYMARLPLDGDADRRA